MRAMYAYLNLRNTPTAPSNIIPIVNTGDVSSQRSIRTPRPRNSTRAKTASIPCTIESSGSTRLGVGRRFIGSQGFTASPMKLVKLSTS